MTLESIIAWIFKEKEWIFSGIGVFLIGGVIAAIRKTTKEKSNNTKPQKKISTTEGDVHFIQRSDVREREVFYPVPYSHTPHLEIKFIDGYFTNLEILEQRPDGFKVKVGGSSASSVGRGITAHWVATGIFHENHP